MKGAPLLFRFLTAISSTLVVPVLYIAVYRARRALALTAVGKLGLPARLYCDAGISDRERARRKERNTIWTTITFIAWLTEVS
jgi:hypothetical protein